MGVKSRIGRLYPALSLLLALLYLHHEVYGDSELQTLIALKASLDPQNKFLGSWLSASNPCNTFLGVECNNQSKVVNISLPALGLPGMISPAISNLTSLSTLVLGYNKLKGEIPKEIANLINLRRLYLNGNNISGIIPQGLGRMKNLVELDLCCNKLSGIIPADVGSSTNLEVLMLQHNQLYGPVPPSLGNLKNLSSLDVSHNDLNGSLPDSLFNLKKLKLVYFQNNNNLTVSASNSTGKFEPAMNAPISNNGIPSNESSCKQKGCSGDSGLSRQMQITVITGSVALVVTVVGVVLIIAIRHVHQRHKVSGSSESAFGELDINLAKEVHRTDMSPLAAMDCNAWDALSDVPDGGGFFKEQVSTPKFNLEDIEHATQSFSDSNLLGKNMFSSVYKGVLRDGSSVAIRSINMASCKAAEGEFIKGMNLLTSLKHNNLVTLRGYCCSRSRGESFLVYDFAPNGKLSKYLDVEAGSSHVLDWPQRSSIIKGIAQGIAYLHSSNSEKRALIHRCISAKKILLDQHFNPLIADSGIYRLLEDDIVFGAIKASAAMGYLAPEYITTGRFTEQSDTFAFGVIILQLLSGKKKIPHSVRFSSPTRYEDFIDNTIKDLSKKDAVQMAEIAIRCCSETPEVRPSMEAVICEVDC